ncbi:MAG: geranylgeranyl reductase family protein [Acidobacteriota bacterium]|nr:geranylgeranyl reductase family protein [Acidobacteriota bacterium]MDE3043216.1 geranylgeranyl reductase family protein [Acidobacteriota bacterium]MDE3106538.1 geranylgeranyl reductase family protein [Acidobacteriota bacterium]MDE3222626.1 geranylgeranyl reductase family protein [Acidobacteriota bacterium]
MQRLAELPTPTPHYDALIVGAGPSGSSCAYWLARAGWSVLLIEKKHFPREKTCGDGLTPRSVFQLQAMGLEDQLIAHGHRYEGLRAFGFGASLEMKWPEHPTFPNYGYTITRFNLDGLVAETARNHGATVLNYAEVVGLLEPGDPSPTKLRAAAGVVVRDTETGDLREIKGRYVIVADGQNSRLGRELGTERNRSWPMGMALRGYYASERHDEGWIDSHLDIRDTTGAVVPGYGWIFPLGDGRVNVGVGLLSTGGAWKGVNTTKLQEYFVAQVGEAWGLNESTSLGAPTGGRLPMGLAIGPRVGVNTLVIGDAAGTINPFNGEGIAYGYETGRLAAGVVAEALVTRRPEALELYDERLDQAYRDYYRVARAFVRLISQPQILSVCVGAGLRIAPLMNELLAVMANLMRNDQRGPAEVGYRALVRLTKVLPDQVFDLLLGDATREPARLSA